MGPGKRGSAGEIEIIVWAGGGGLFLNDLAKRGHVSGVRDNQGC